MHWVAFVACLLVCLTDIDLSHLISWVSGIKLSFFFFFARVRVSVELTACLLTLYLLTVYFFIKIYRGGPGVVRFFMSGNSFFLCCITSFCLPH